MTASIEDQKYQERLRAGRRALELAKIYLDDGAPISAAHHLRTAADEFERAGAIRNAAFTA